MPVYISLRTPSNINNTITGIQKYFSRGCNKVLNNVCKTRHVT